MAIYDTTDNRITRADDWRDRASEKSYRLVTPEDLRERDRVVNSLFYGFSAEWLSQACLVDVDTAARWKRGELAPSPQALMLFELHRDGRILGSEWKGWKILRAEIVDPEGNGTTQGQLRAYYLNYRLLRELLRDRPDVMARYLAAHALVG